MVEKTQSRRFNVAMGFSRHLLNKAVRFRSNVSSLLLSKTVIRKRKLTTS